MSNYAFGSVQQLPRHQLSMKRVKWQGLGACRRLLLLP